jgi:hypothetical protein
LDSHPNRNKVVVVGRRFSGEEAGNSEGRGLLEARSRRAAGPWDSELHSNDGRNLMLREWSDTTISAFQRHSAQNGQLARNFKKMAGLWCQ